MTIYVKNGNVTITTITTMSSTITTVHIFGSPKMDININIGWYQDLDQQKTFLFLHLIFPSSKKFLSDHINIEKRFKRNRENKRRIKSLN